MHPILFSIPTPWGAVPIYSYGVMLGLSLLVAWYFIMYMGSKVERMDKDLMANCFVVTALTAILFARLFYVFTNLDEFPTILSWFYFRSGGLVAYGGFLGGFFGAWGYLKWRKVPLLPWADLVAPTLGSGLALTTSTAATTASPCRRARLRGSRSSAPSRTGTRRRFRTSPSTSSSTARRPMSIT